MKDIKAAFLDRDGTVIVDKGYLCDPAQIELIPGSATAVKRLNEAGYLVFGISNQSGVARGYFTLQDAASMNQRTIEMVSAAGGTIEEIFFCPHYPEGSVTEFAVSCGCRKPATGMVDKAKEKYGIAPVETLVIGDKAIDILLGHAIGARTALVLTGYGKAEMEKIKTGGLAPPDIYAKDLKEAVDFLLDGSNR